MVGKLTTIWIPRVFVCRSANTCIFDHANACATMRLLVEIHNKYLTSSLFWSPLWFGRHAVPKSLHLLNSDKKNLNLDGDCAWWISEMVGGASALSPRPVTAAFQLRAHSKLITTKTYSQNLIRESLQSTKVTTQQLVAQVRDTGSPAAQCRICAGAFWKKTAA